MLTFLRKIRKSMINSGSLGKYSIYAIGEIALVVIGILIALQINNWNEFNKQIETEGNYLERLKIDLQNDTSYLLQRIQISENQIQSFQKFVHELYETQEVEADFIKLLGLVYWYRNDLILQNKTYSEMISTGRFSNMADKEKKELMRDFYIAYDQAAKHIAEMNESGGTIYMQVYPKFLKYYEQVSPLFDREKMYRKSDWEFVNKPTSEEFKTLESAAAFYYYKESIFIDYYEKLLQMAINLINQLETK